MQVTVRAGPALIGVAVPPPPAPAYRIGKTIEATASFGEAVEVTGAPELALDLGGVRRVATFDRDKSGPTELVFRYTVSREPRAETRRLLRLTGVQQREDERRIALLFADRRPDRHAAVGDLDLRGAGLALVVADGEPPGASSPSSPLSQT